MAKGKTTQAEAKEIKTKEGPYTDYFLQFLILLGIVVPWIVLSYVLNMTVEDIVSDLYERLHLAIGLTDFAYLSDSKFWILVVALSTPHVYYYFVWTNAQAYYKTCTSSSTTSLLGEPFQVFAKSAHVIKAFQLSAFIGWFFTIENPETLKEYLLASSVPQLLLCGQLLAFGQLFNMAVYTAIGEAGVYYGCRLGKEVPWVYGFPYSAIPHAQYLGATLSLWGLFLALATPAAVRNGDLALGVVMTIYYTFSSYVEQYL